MALAVTVFKSLLLNRTALGTKIRATSMDIQAAQLVGIRIASFYALAFAIAAALAGIAVALFSTNQAFSPVSAPDLTLKAFVVVALGGLGSAWAALAGGLGLGLGEVLGGALIGISYTNQVSFGILVVVLLVRPSGLLGQQSYAGERGHRVSTRTESEIAEGDLASGAPLAPAPRRRRATLVIAVLVLLAIAFPFAVNDYDVGVGTTVIMLGVLAASWNLIGGYAGYPSFGHAVFWGLGAYGAAVPMVKLGVPFPVGFLCGGLVSALLALVIGLPALRLRGHYFAIATLGILSVVQQVVANADSITGGGGGLTLPLSSLGLQTFDQVIYLIMLAVLGAVLLFTFWMSRSRLGYGLVAIRENEVAARVMGVNTTLYKVIAFVMSGLFCGFAGATYAYWRSSLDPPVAFDFNYNVLLVIMAFFGGAGTVPGPLLGALILGVLSEWLRGVLVQYHLLVFGVVIVLTVIFAPNGLMEYLDGRRRLSIASLLENIREHSV